MRLECLSAVADPRRAQGRRYPRPYILLFSILAMLCGATSNRKIQRFIKAHRERLNEWFGVPWKRAPAPTSIRHILQRLEPAELERAFRAHSGPLRETREALAYILTPRAFKPLKADGVPAEILVQLSPLKGLRYPTQERFYQALDEVLGAAGRAQYQGHTGGVVSPYEGCLSTPSPTGTFTRQDSLSFAQRDNDEAQPSRLIKGV